MFGEALKAVSLEALQKGIEKAVYEITGVRHECGSTKADFSSVRSTLFELYP